MRNTFVLTLSFFLLFNLISEAQRNSDDVFVDKNGVLRWGTSKEEVRAFGINYTVPFAHAYRTAKNMGIDIQKAIDQDVYHFARLGFDLYRVHVWDTEISDTLGNLLPSENLRLFDYMVMKMKERGMKFIITPIAYWGNGWPEPDEPTPGFSRKYGKDACLTNPEAIRAQERYLFQFLNHVNSYTGIPYKNDPDIIAFEVSNEPHHRESPENVTTFINRMVKAMRNTGCKKPILYNITHSIHLADAYFKSAMQGGTFQWYPTGLGARHELGGNLLPNVDRYVIPFANNPKFKSMAKIVYEFDAADVGRSYIYPAMARSFREAGMQVATHFSYDPTYMAYANTEYGTHYMNLAYTPQKALSLMISSAVFHRVPMYKSFGRYPDNTSFDVFRVDDERDLAEMITEKQFIYTNNTSSQIPAIDKLEQVAGSGNSTVVQYEGTGAYFLDRIRDGVWRLEVMPDAIWIKDPFERTSLKKEIAVINWRTWPMTIQLPDLGSVYAIQALNAGNNLSGKAIEKTIQVKPGTYVLTRQGITSGIHREDKWKNILIGEYVAPQASVTKIHVLHQPVVELSSGGDYQVSATIVSVQPPEDVELHVWVGFRPQVIKMTKQHGYTYTATITADRLQPGFLRYFITVKEQGKFYTFPAGAQTYPGDWDFYATESYTVPVVERTSPLYLFNAFTDSDQLIRQWVRGSSIIPADGPGKAEVLVNIEQLFREDPEQKDKERIYDYSMRYFFGRKVEGRKKDLQSFTKVVFTGRSLNDKPCTVQLALVAKDGSAYAHSLVVTPEKGEFIISLPDLRSVKPVTMPRPYPTFLSYYFEPSSVSDFSIKDTESLQISIGPGIPAHQLQEKHGIAIESIRLEK
ncbi:MAG: cellulase family glycosylhydrolase [Cyclobacteriaceae bacterium]|nr:cellulase family glycosylhydrolase [Cyclobacteriaceae bacterium]